MKKLIWAFALVALSGNFLYGYERGDTVYTCHWNQDGFMWLGGRYHACTHIVLEKIGSRYRIESLNSCQGYSSGERRLVSGNSLFSSSSIKFSKWGNQCKSEDIAK